MDTTVTALKNLFAVLGGSADAVADVSTIPDMINAIAAEKVPPVTAAAELQATKVYGIDVSTLQSADTAVSGNAITGTLYYISSGVLVDVWGAGNFLVIKFTASDWNVYDSVMVGLDPSVSSGLVDIKDDPDHNGVFKITDKNAQVLVIEAKIGNITVRKTFDLSGLTLNNE